MDKKTKALLKAGLVSLFLLGANLTSTAIAQSTGAFAVTGSMMVPRAFHMATLLRDGKVLIAGGVAPWSLGAPRLVLASAEIYDPSTGTFASTGDMTTAHGFLSATLLVDGRVLITGSSSDRPFSAEIYDPSIGTFSPTGEMTTTGGPATLLSDGRVLIAGIPTAEIYDPATGTFTVTSAYARTGEPQRMRTFTSSLLPDGRVLLVGDGGFATYSERTEVYDPNTGTFSLMGPLPHRIEPNQWLDEFSTTLLTNGKVLVTGGENEWHYLPYAELYDPSTGAWDTTGNMTLSRSLHTSTLLPGGTVLIAGGYDEDVGPISAELYDPATGTFSATGRMNTGRFGHTATLLLDGTVLVAGGGTSSAELYVPSPAIAPLVVTDLRFDRTNVVAGTSYSVNVSGSNLTPQTFFDVRFSVPGVNAYIVALNWQRGLSATHNVPAGVVLGRWAINGVRAHEDQEDHTGSFDPISAAITVCPR